MTRTVLALSGSISFAVSLLACGSGDGNSSNDDSQRAMDGVTASDASACNTQGDASCAPIAPVCDNDARPCGDCVDDGDCVMAGASHCSPTLLVCVQCVGAGDCGGDTPFCHGGINRCVQCLTHGDCTDPATPHCANLTCMGCQSDEACADREGTPVCDTGRDSATRGMCIPEPG